MARSTMADLIQRVRTLTYAGTAEYTLGTAVFWDDDQIQTVLDQRRQDVDVRLADVTPLVHQGVLRWRDYRTDYHDLEATDGGTAVFVVTDGMGTVVPLASYEPDYVRGVVLFNDSQGGSARHLRARAYDVHGAAADLLDAWSAREKLAFNFSGDDQSFQRSQKFQMLGEMAAKYRAQSWPVSVRTTRGDASVEGWQS